MGLPFVSVLRWRTQDIPGRPQKLSVYFHISCCIQVVKKPSPIRRFGPPPNSSFNWFLWVYIPLYYTLRTMINLLDRTRKACKYKSRSLHDKLRPVESNLGSHTEDSGWYEASILAGRCRSYYHHQEGGVPMHWEFNVGMQITVHGRLWWFFGRTPH